MDANPRKKGFESQIRMGQKETGFKSRNQRLQKSDLNHKIGFESSAVNISAPKRNLKFKNILGKKFQITNPMPFQKVIQITNPK